MQDTVPRVSPLDLEVVRDYPPLWDEIRARLSPPRGVIFAWGTRVYNPHGVHVPHSLLVHEAVHAVQQGSDVEGWWRRYMDDPAFRLDQELPAHAEEYAAMVHGPGATRLQRRSARKALAKRLAGPLYGRLMTEAAARRYLSESLSSAGLAPVPPGRASR